MTPSVLVVGGGLAGFSVAQELRRRGFAGELSIIDPEGPPYDRPPLSKDYLAGTMPEAQLALAPPGWFEEQGVRLVADRAVGLVPDAGEVLLAGGRVEAADLVVLATGGSARRLPVPGADLPGLHVLRTAQDADRLRAALGPGRRLAVVGAGLVGAEVASVASALGTAVTLIDPVEVPLRFAVGQAIAERLHALHAAHGVRTVAGLTAAFERSGGEWRVVLATGEVVAADAVLVAAGIEPSTGLAQSAGLAVDGGILVDAEQRAGHPRVYAVGDCARTRLPDGTPLRRHEHWDAAVRDAQRAAASVLGQEPPAPTADWFWTDRYGHHVEACGDLTTGGPVLRHLPDGGLVDFRLDAGGMLTGAASLDAGTAVRAARRLIDRRSPVDPAQLADPAVDLRRLAR